MALHLQSRETQLYLLPVRTRVPLKFGAETLTRVTCSRVHLRCETSDGPSVWGWGETPLSVQWVWPSALSYTERERALISFSRHLARAWVEAPRSGHPLSVGHAFLSTELPRLRDEFNATERAGAEPLPLLAALVCCAPFDLALHDAYGIACDRPIYELYGREHCEDDLASFFEDAAFAEKYVGDYLAPPPETTIPAWHLVGGKDPLSRFELEGEQPDDGYPTLLRDWIERDELRCLKIKLRGNNREWDLARLREVSGIGLGAGVQWLTADFNCQVTDPAYVTSILDELQANDPAIYEALLYVEQPFPYDLEKHMIDVHSVSERKPLFMDESAHDWRLVRLGHQLGWNGVALKTCKTQTGALLSLCWAREHGMQIMVQDLTNPMLAQVSHLQLGYHAGTIMGVETNSMQFYPDASLPEAAVHPGMFGRRSGTVDLSSALGRPGFGFRAEEIARELPEPDTVVSA